MLRYIENQGWELTTDKDLKSGYYDSKAGIMITRDQLLKKTFPKDIELFNVIHINKVKK